MRGVAVLAVGLAAVGVPAAGLSGCGTAPARELERDPSRSAATQISVFLQATLPDRASAESVAVTLRRLAGVDAVIVPPPVPSSPAAVHTS